MSIERADEDRNTRPALLRRPQHDRPGRAFASGAWYWAEFKRRMADTLWHDTWHRYPFLISCGGMVVALICTAIWE